MPNSAVIVTVNAYVDVDVDVDVDVVVDVATAPNPANTVLISAFTHSVAPSPGGIITRTTCRAGSPRASSHNSPSPLIPLS